MARRLRLPAGRGGRRGPQLRDVGERAGGAAAPALRGPAQALAHVARRLESLTLPGPAGALEAVLQHREGEIPEVAALVCHPHPLHGGTLHNKVVHRVAATLHEMGAAVLRFNFRGAGKSEGVHDEGRGELEDARAALRWLEQRYPGARRWLAGFSFGSWIAARLAAHEPAERLILVSPPLHRSDFDSMRRSEVPKLVLQGTADDICPP